MIDNEVHHRGQGYEYLRALGGGALGGGALALFITPHLFTSTAELDALVAALRSIAEGIAGSA